jgi:hypothetical protein
VYTMLATTPTSPLDMLFASGEDAFGSLADTNAYVSRHGLLAVVVWLKRVAAISAALTHCPIALLLNM